MPRACSICVHSQSAAITKALGSKNGSLRGVASRFGVNHTSLLRHRTNCMGVAVANKAPTPPTERNGAAGAFRFDSKAATSPQSLTETVALLVDKALDLLENATAADDRRTALGALREARDGLALLMRTAGMLAPEGAIVVDARQQTVQLIGKLTEDDMRALVRQAKALEAAAAIEPSEAEAC